MPASNKPFDIYDKRSLRIQMENLQSLLVYLESIPVPTPCSACQWHKLGKCNAWGGEMIPAETLPVGCEKFEFNPQAAPF